MFARQKRGFCLPARLASLTELWKPESVTFRSSVRDGAQTQARSVATSGTLHSSPRA